MKEYKILEKVKREIWVEDNLNYAEILMEYEMSNLGLLEALLRENEKGI